MVVIIVQLLKVSFSVKPKYLLTNQKPLSFTCDKIEAPQAIAITNNALLISVTPDVKSGAVRPAAVIIATVAEPCKILTTAAEIKANNKNPKPAPAK